MLKTSDLQIEFMGVVPRISIDDFEVSPQQITSLSALLTFKGEPIGELFRELIEGDKDVEKKTEKIMKKSSLRGHASMGTTPVLAFSFRGSKFIDSMMSGLVFSSSLMASGRRTGAAADLVVFPSSIEKNKKAKEIYQKQSIKNMDLLNKMVEEGVRKDEASKILQYGMFGTGIMTLSVESLISFKKECEAEGEWMPEEGQMVLEQFEKELEGFGLEKIYTSRDSAPRNPYTYPNIFKDPSVGNIVRDLYDDNDISKIINVSVIEGIGLEKRLDEIKKLQKEVLKDKASVKQNWPKLLEAHRKVARDYGNSVSVDILSSVAWRVWGEKKRHRTVPMVSESIYWCLNRCIEVLDEYSGAKDYSKLAKEDLDRIDKVFSIPPTVRAKPELLQEYLECGFGSINCYKDLVELGVKPRDAIFVVPRAMRIDVFQHYNLYNLIDGYYPLRLCVSAEEQMYKNSHAEAKMIKAELEKQGAGYLAEFIVPKCHVCGFCPEEDKCGSIDQVMDFYDEAFHKEVKKSLVGMYKEKRDKIQK